MQLNTLTKWYSQPLPSHSKIQADWLFTPGFFTPKIKLLGDYSMQLINQGEILADITDAAALGIAPDTKIWCREVIMYIDQKPCVIGRSIATVADMAQTWSDLSERNNTAIGYVLYSDDTIHRTAFECAILQAGDPLDNLARQYDHDSKCFNARRSKFIKNDSVLLVSECFLDSFWKILA